MSKGQPTTFKVGSFLGAFRFTFKAGEQYTWKLQVPNSQSISVKVNEQSPKLPLVEPQLNCKQGEKAILGWMNPNPFDIYLSVGTTNSFVPGNLDLGQPTQLFSGLNKGAFSVPMKSDLSWKLPGKSVQFSQAVTECSCPAVNNRIVKTEVLSMARDYLAIAYEAADVLERASKGRMGKSSKEERARIRDLLRRSKERTVREFKQIEWTLTSTLPESSTACPQEVSGCRTVDDWPLIQSIRTRYDIISSLITRLIMRAGFIEGGDTAKYKDIRMRASHSAQKALESLNTIQRFRVDCTSSSPSQVTTQEKGRGKKSIKSPKS